MKETEEEILRKIELLAGPTSSSNQLNGIIKTAIKTSQSQGQMSSFEAALANWLIEHITDSFMGPYRLGYKAGLIEGKRQEFEDNAFRKEFKEMMGFEWD